MRQLRPRHCRGGQARSTVQLCLARFAAAGLSWPLPATLNEPGLEALLFASLGGSKPGKRLKTEPDWAAIHRELRRAWRDAASTAFPWNDSYHTGTVIL